MSVISIQLIDAMGKKIGKAAGAFPAGNQQIEIPATNLKNGLYLIRLSSNNQLLPAGKCMVSK